MEKSIVELEEKFAHLDRIIDELNNVIYRQSNRIDELEQKIKEY